MNAYVNGEFSPLEAMKSLDVEATELRLRVRELEEYNHALVEITMKRMGEQYDEIVRLREVIEDLRGGE